MKLFSLPLDVGRWTLNVGRSSFTFVGRALSETDGTPSSKRLLFFLAVAASLSFCAFDVIKHGGLSAQVIDLAKFVLGVTGAANVASRISDNMTKPGDGPPPPAPATA